MLEYCNYSQPASIKLDNENIGGHCYTFTLNDVQNKHFVAYSIKDVFDDVEAQKIIDFIKETRFL